MPAGFRVWPDPPVYLTHHAVANTCHFKGATLQNIHINTPVTLTNTHYSITLLTPSIWRDSLDSLSELVLFPLTYTCVRKRFHHPIFVIWNMRPPLFHSRCVWYVLLQGAEQWKWWWWILIIAQSPAYQSSSRGGKQVTQSRGCVQLYVDVITHTLSFW